MSSVKPRMLIVDDEPDMLDFLERVFRTDYQIVRARSAGEALAILDGAEATSGFKVVITDQKMPHVSGVQLLETIGTRHPGLVKVLLSGYTDVPDIERAMDGGGIHNYVVKPIDSKNLRHAVADAIDRHARGRALSDSQVRLIKIDM